MTKEGFNEIIDLIIENISKRSGICAVLTSFYYNKKITIHEYDEMKCRIDKIFSRMTDEGKQTYDEDGNPSDDFAYLFPDNEKRIEFLNNLKENYEPIQN